MEDVQYVVCEADRLLGQTFEEGVNFGPEMYVDMQRIHLGYVEYYFLKLSISLSNISDLYCIFYGHDRDHTLTSNCSHSKCQR